MRLMSQPGSLTVRSNGVEPDRDLAFETASYNDPIAMVNPREGLAMNEDHNSDPPGFEAVYDDDATTDPLNKSTEKPASVGDLKGRIKSTRTVSIEEMNRSIDAGWSCEHDN